MNDNDSIAALRRDYEELRKDFNAMKRQFGLHFIVMAPYIAGSLAYILFGR